MKFYLRILGLISIVLLASRCKKEEVKVLPVASITRSIEIEEGTADENTSAELTISIKGDDIEYPVEVGYYFINESTTEDDLDFISSASPKMVTFNEGEKSKKVSIGIVADDVIEISEEFKVTLTRPSNCILGQDKQCTVKILDDEGCTDIEVCGYITPESYDGYSLVWQDEFASTTIDETKWTHEIGGNGWGNQEEQYYTDRVENSYIENGNLVIEAKKESYNGSSYTSARMITSGKYSVKYGRIDIRAKLPNARGTWPALWMLGDNIWTESWPKCGEIDIMELVGYDPTTVHSTVHWGNSTNDKGINGGGFYKEEGFTEKYHVYTLIWDYNQLQFLVDDEVIHTIPRNQIDGGYTYPFDKSFFFIFNIAVGGTWGGLQGIDQSAFPQKMYVDYIRVFQ